MKKLNKTRLITVIIMIIACLFVFAACKSNPTPDTAQDTANEMAADMEEAGDDVMDGNVNNNGTNNNGTNNTGINNTGTNMEYTVYFANAERTGLVAETRTSVTDKNTTDAKARMVVSALIEGPKNNQYKAVLPRTTMINTATLDSAGVMNLDLTKLGVSDFNRVGVNEKLTVNAIAASLMQFPEIKKVRITVDNRPLKLGEKEYTEAFTFDQSLIKK